MRYRPASVDPMRGSWRVMSDEPSTKQNALSFGYVRWHCGHCFIAGSGRYSTASRGTASTPRLRAPRRQGRSRSEQLADLLQQAAAAEHHLEALLEPRVAL